MTEFKVSLEIQLQAETPLEAAPLAIEWAIQDPMLYYVQNDETGKIDSVDLDDESVLPVTNYEPFIIQK